MLYYVVSVIFSWFMVGSFFLIFAILTKAIFFHVGAGLLAVSTTIIGIYTVLLIGTLMIAIGVKVDLVERWYHVLMFLFGFCMIFAIVAAIDYTIKSDGFFQIIVILSAVM